MVNIKEIVKEKKPEEKKPEDKKSEDKKTEIKSEEEQEGLDELLEEENIDKSLFDSNLFPSGIPTQRLNTKDLFLSSDEERVSELSDIVQDAPTTTTSDLDNKPLYNSGGSSYDQGDKYGGSTNAYEQPDNSMDFQRSRLQTGSLRENTMGERNTMQTTSFSSRQSRDSPKSVDEVGDLVKYGQETTTIESKKETRKHWS